MKERPILTRPFQQMTTPWSAETHWVSHLGGERFNPQHNCLFILVTSCVY